ncbi:zinc-binding metallopeptidase [Sphingobacterium bovistauri]|uniref:Zinc-binding metallopeptidase n=1 Tax=Sphingobacterium bovistauri TaxID=2781959 RepID=A0ABS7Z7R4_9SPHI|nr:putative zinc-binding metallopeptidase [Sphingobacterium bovistauri]MCA5006199.1 putative zinc-binding metallopeptidase [Sphingobacterium bovistauri]
MKKRLKFVSCIVLSLFLMNSCKKDEVLTADLTGLGGEQWAKTELDNWLFDNYIKPYNIEVKYKWDRSELGDIYKTIVPIKEDLVKPVMDVIKRTWIEPYVTVKGDDFFKTYAQKQFYLAGSPSYNSNGTVTLGTAEAGRKIVMLNLNTFNASNKNAVKQILHTMHHEFGHILHQNIAISPEYQKVTPADYTATWFNFTDVQARDLGFITAYSRSNKDDDFVEMIATLLEGGEAYFDNVINNLFVKNGTVIKRSETGIYEKNEDARNKLLLKRQFVIDYLKDKWGIELAELQKVTQKAIDDQVKTPDFHNLLGIGKRFTSLNINPQKVTKLSSKFLTAFNTANTSLKADAKPQYVDNITLSFTSATRIVLRVNTVELSATNLNGVNADFNFDVSIVDGVFTMKYADTQPTTANYVNARAIEGKIAPLLNYFKDQEFKIQWIDNIIPQSKEVFGGIFKTGDPTSYIYGIL